MPYSLIEPDMSISTMLKKEKDSFASLEKQSKVR